MNPIPEGQLEELVTLAVVALTPIPAITNRFNSGQKASVIRTREKYRRLSFELAGELAKEVLELREQIRDSVSAETVRE